MSASSDRGRPLVIAGIPRSGTTWTRRVLEGDASLVSLMEPDSEGRRAEAVWGKRRVGRFPVLGPGDQADSYRELWSWILDGAEESARLRLATRMLTLVRPAGRRRFLEGRVEPVMEVAGLLGRRPAGPTNPALADHRLLVKTVHAPLCIEWIASEFDIDVVVLLRHPGSVLASWLALDLNDQHVPLERNPLVLEVARRWDVPPPGPDHLEQVIWKVGVLTCALEQAAARHPQWTVRTHEQLCRQPDQEFRRLYTDLGLTWSAEAESTLAGNNRPGVGFHMQRVASELPDDWKQRLTPHQVAELHRVLAGFPFRTWSASDFVATDG